MMDRRTFLGLGAAGAVGVAADLSGFASLAPLSRRPIMAICADWAVTTKFSIGQIVKKDGKLSVVLTAHISVNPRGCAVVTSDIVRLGTIERIIDEPR